MKERRNGRDRRWRDRRDTQDWRCRFGHLVDRDHWLFGLCLVLAFLALDHWLAYHWVNRPLEWIAAAFSERILFGGG